MFWTTTLDLSSLTISLTYTYLFGSLLEISENLSLYNTQPPFGCFKQLSKVSSLQNFVFMPFANAVERKWLLKYSIHITGRIKSCHFREGRPRDISHHACSPLHGVLHFVGEPQWLVQQDVLYLQAFWQEWVTGLHFL